MGGSALQAGLPNSSSVQNAKKADDLKKACDEAYDYGPAAKSCSHAVWYVVQKLVNSKEPLRTANDLIDYMTFSNDWREVNVDDAWKLANEGKVVVGGKKDDPNGHVIVIYPGTKIGGGGYKYNYTNKMTAKKEQLVMRSHGMLPRCLSRSMGQWPGAVSKGDKTVFDPWGNDAAFKQVKFWTIDKP
jgi:hypothetical protein